MDAVAYKVAHVALEFVRNPNCRLFGVPFDNFGWLMVVFFLFICQHIVGSISV